MKRLPTIVAAVVLLVVLVAYMCTFEVRSTEVAILKTAGRPVGGTIDEPGLKFKWPWPIQTVVKYDSRKRVLEDKTEETGTKDGKNVILTTYTVWQITDPQKFHENFQIEENGISNLRSLIQTCKNAEVGQRGFSEFVSVDEHERKLTEIEQAMLARIRESAEAEYGVKILDFGIKRLGLPQSVTTSIFDSMKANQQRKASRYIEEGKAEARKITADANATRERIIAAAQRKVADIEARGQEKVSEYYKQFAEHPELRIFLDNLRAMKKALSTRTTLILPTDVAPFSVFLREERQALLDQAKGSGGGDQASETTGKSGEARPVKAESGPEVLETSDAAAGTPDGSLAGAGGG